MDKKEVEQFADVTIKAENLKGWKMEWEDIDPCGFCYEDRKIFTIPPIVTSESNWTAKEYVLHEISHAISGAKEHGEIFYTTYCDLIKKHIGENS